MAPSLGRYFYLKSKLNSLYLEARDDSNTIQIPGKWPVLLWSKAEQSETQIWYQDPITRTFRNKKNNFCLSISDTNRLVMNLYDSENASQTWQYNKNKQTVEHIENHMQVFEVVGASKSEGAEIFVSDYHGKDTQLWKMEPLTIKYFFIKNIRNNLVMDVERSKSGQGTRIILYKQKLPAEDNQLWYEDFEGNIRPRLSDKIVLSATDSSVTSSHYNASKNNQFWFISGNRIVNMHDYNQVITVQDLVTPESDCFKPIGTLKSHLYTGSDDQHWTFIYI